MEGVRGSALAMDGSFCFWGSAVWIELACSVCQIVGILAQFAPFQICYFTFRCGFCSSLMRLLDCLTDPALGPLFGSHDVAFPRKFLHHRHPGILGRYLVSLEAVWYLSSSGLCVLSCMWRAALW